MKINEIWEPWPIYMCFLWGTTMEHFACMDDSASNQRFYCLAVFRKCYPTAQNCQEIPYQFSCHRNSIVGDNVSVNM